MRWRSLKRTVAATSTPLELNDALAHLRIDSGDPDAQLVRSYLEAVTDAVENRLGRALMSSTWRATFDEWPEDRLLPLPMAAPLTSVTSVQYVDTSGTVQTWSTGSYTVRTDDVPGAIALNWGETWPTVRYEPGTIRVTYVAGHSAAEDVPALVRQGIMVGVANFYENRESVVVGTSAARIPGINLLDQYRIRW